MTIAELKALGMTDKELADEYIMHTGDTVRPFYDDSGINRALRSELYGHVMAYREGSVDCINIEPIGSFAEDRARNERLAREERDRQLALQNQSDQ